MPKAQFLNFIPQENTWDIWNGNLCHFFSEQHIPYLPEEEWRTVAQVLVNNPVWASYNVPTPDGFDDWQSWALEFTLAVNGPNNR